MRWLRPAVLSFLLTSLVVASFVGGYYLGDERGRHSTEVGSGFSILWQVSDLLKDKFLGEIPTQQAQVYASAHGLVGSYGDPFTVFVEPERRMLERDDMKGEFGGIGATLQRGGNGEVMLYPTAGGPAARAGVIDGDWLVAVDGKTIASDLPNDQLLLMIRGTVGTVVKLSLKRAEAQATIEVAITRERIESPTVQYRVLDGANHRGYARVLSFSEVTSRQLETAMAELDRSGVDALVLDLRGNGGGLLDAAIDVTSQLVSGGQVLSEIKRDGATREYPVRNVSGPARAWSLVVLVDAGTASASEIVAGALRDHGRAVLIGEKTYGKGSVQEVHDLPDGSSLHVTVARWLTPKGTRIDKTGLTPDIQVAISADDRSAGRDPQLERAVAWLDGQG